MYDMNDVEVEQLCEQVRYYPDFYRKGEELAKKVRDFIDHYDLKSKHDFYNVADTDMLTDLIVDLCETYGWKK